MFNFQEIYVSLFTNIILLFSLGSIYILLPFGKSRKGLFFKLIIGFVSGLIGLIIMSTQFYITEGFLLDTRSILVTLVGGFFGAIPLMVTFTMTAALRFYQGGSGTLTGILVILVTGLAGYFYGKYRLPKFKRINLKLVLEFYVLGVVTHILMLLCFYTLPFETANFVLGKIALPVMLLYPLATVPLAVVLFKQKQNVAMSEKIDHISKHDYLTGLYNRFYFENAMNNFDYTDYLPLSIIMGDVNGLKIVNDSFGHIAGDELLVTISEILKSSISSKDILSRWGGDEFVIILPNTTNVKANEIVLNITRLCDKSKGIRKIKPSISLGAATRTSINSSMEETLKLAEDLMYRNKLSAGKSVRSNLISILENALLERSLETLTHTHNMEELCVMIAKECKLEKHEVDEISLIARLHDIGKIGVSDKILLKNGKLTKEEFDAIKKHPEIGYRILSSIEELEHIAVGVLHHHEKWDGSGYPQGLANQEIPLVSRILAVADAYEVMTNGRIYKDAISKTDAIQELVRCSGTQFDPHIVDIFVGKIS